jgi:uncharacterized protein (DUF1330 family)
MPALMIITVAIHDRARFIEEYGKPTAALIEKHGGQYLLRAPGCKSYEGNRPDGLSVVVSQWPDKAAIDGFWNSAEYQPLKAIRQTFSDADVQVVEVP